MISYNEALEIVLSSATTLACETVPLARALRRVVATGISAPFPIPRFDHSAVDGYVVGAASGDPPLEVARVIAAGDPSGGPLNVGECARIFTGSPVPPGSTYVAMQEDCRERDGLVEIPPHHQGETNIRLQGEEFPIGAVALPIGSELSPAGIGIVSSFGYESVEVYRQPRISILATGDELVRPGAPLRDGQIYESNASSLQAAVVELGISPTVRPATDDNPRSTSEAIEEALTDSDLLITTGGVSVGDRDVVREAFGALGFEERFWRVAMKPGKPVWFGVRHRPGKPPQAAFGLPGNPLSVLATFEFLAKPFIRANSGCRNPRPTGFQFPIAEKFEHRSGRDEFVPSILGLKSVSPQSRRGSHMVGGLALANSWIRIPADVSQLKAGDVVETFVRGSS